MYIIVVGGGKVGYYLAKALLDEGHEVLVIEKLSAKVGSICDELGSVCMRGDGCEATTLNEAGADRADMLIATTGDDEDNLVTCQVARHKFNVPRTVAIINNPKNETIFKKLGIDITVSSTNLILENLEQEVPTHPLTHLLSIGDKGLEIVEIRVPAESVTVGKKVKELSLPAGTMLSLIVRKDEKPLLPSDDTVLQPDDQVIAITSHESEEALRTALRGA